MRLAISTDETTGSSRFQTDSEIGHEDFSHDISYRETLNCVDYERDDAPPLRMAEISWTTADVLRRASDTALALDAHRRGMVLVGVQNILSGKQNNENLSSEEKQNE